MKQWGWSKTITAGCDVGSLTAEVVLMENESIISSSIIKVRPRPEQSANDAMNEALVKAELSLEDIDYCISTGYGREKIPFANDNISEISCHGKGANWLIPSIKTVIDIGGQDCKVIRIDENGKLENFIMNNKCAAGTGRFLEIMAKTLEVELEELGPLSLRSKNPIPITNVCTVYAEVEVASFISEGSDIHDIAAGINQAMATRVKALAMKVGVEEDIAISGGVAKNTGVVKYLEEMLGLTPKEFEVDPQILGALGASLFAKNKIVEQK